MYDAHSEQSQSQLVNTCEDEVSQFKHMQHNVTTSICNARDRIENIVYFTKSKQLDVSTISLKRLRTPNIDASFYTPYTYIYNLRCVHAYTYVWVYVSDERYSPCP